MADLDTAPPTSVRIPEALKTALQRRAQADGRKFSQYVIRVLEKHVDETPEPQSEAPEIVSISSDDPTSHYPTSWVHN